MSKRDFGGKILLSFSSGERFSLRSTLTLDTAGYSIESVTNQDGSADRVATNKTRGAEITFADRGLDLDALMKGDRFNATFEEEFTGVTFYFTNGFFTGDPKINRTNGEVSGLKIEADNISRRN